MVNENNKQKSSIHPNYKELKVVMTNKEEIITKSTYKDDVMLLDIDKHTHPAWSKTKEILNTKADAIAKFQKKFGSIHFSSIKKK